MQCIDCDRYFVTKYDLSKHMSIHLIFLFNLSEAIFATESVSTSREDTQRWDALWLLALQSRVFHYRRTRETWRFSAQERETSTPSASFNVKTLTNKCLQYKWSGMTRYHIIRKKCSGVITVIRSISSISAQSWPSIYQHMLIIDCIHANWETIYIIL